MEQAQHDRFKFGENWSEYSALISNEQIAQAERGILKLIEKSDLQGKDFLDIGSGSGLHSLAALKIGVAKIEAFDIDQDSVNTTRAVLQRFAGSENWSAEQNDILKAGLPPRWDVVYSWGVLHHTGNMWTAIRNAASGVKLNGVFAIAIYSKTPLCGFWTWEKRFYSRAPKLVQKIIQVIFKSSYVLGLLVSGRNPKKYISNYKGNRGMDWHHDVHDWLGGYPYESASIEELKRFMSPLGFVAEAQTSCNTKWGVLGVGCNEIRFRKVK